MNLDELEEQIKDLEQDFKADAQLGLELDNYYAQRNAELLRKVLKLIPVVRAAQAIERRYPGRKFYLPSQTPHPDGELRSALACAIEELEK